LSLQHADVGELTLLHVDLRQCRFAGAVGLDRLTIESQPDLWFRLPGRRAILDECDATRREATTGEIRLVASCYRQLRKGREAAKDEPGSADFYYGEMEMRRLEASRTRAFEWVLLSLYWLVSGYSLRAWRALIALLVVVLLGGVALGRWGIITSPSQGRAIGSGLLTATEVAMFRNSGEPLTTFGRVIAVPLRLIAPLVFLQLVLALRSQVRR
jgi:hypothetical protein